MSYILSTNMTTVVWIDQWKNRKKWVVSIDQWKSGRGFLSIRQKLFITNQFKFTSNTNMCLKHFCQFGQAKPKLRVVFKLNNLKLWTKLMNYYTFIELKFENMDEEIFVCYYRTFVRNDILRRGGKKVRGYNITSMN